jgi:hypothetical protein
MEREKKLRKSPGDRGLGRGEEIVAGASKSNGH